MQISLTETTKIKNLTGFYTSVEEIKIFRLEIE